MATKTKTEFEAAYARLNPGQKSAVDTIEGPVMVLAGPGTGKTQTLTVRIGKILQETQLDPWNILCLTFTESAAVEMRQRLANLIGSSAYSVHISTFHSFCNDVMQAHPEIFALAPNWQPLADVERVQLIQEVLDGLPGTSPLKPFGNPYLYLKDCVQHIQALKQEDISPKDFADILATIGAFLQDVAKDIKDFSALKPNERTDAACEHIYAYVQKSAAKHKLPHPLQEYIQGRYEDYTESIEVAEDKRAAGKARTKFKNDLKKFADRLDNHLPRQKELVAVYERYQRQLHMRGRYDFEDMIIMVADAFKKHANLLSSYQEQFQYILVDEFQDTNGAQNEVVDLLGSYDNQPNVFVVGDDKQSIYRFQGASLANMLSFYERYKEHVRVISLSENYRSQPGVLEAASAVIANNTQLLAKNIPGISNELQAMSGRKAEKITMAVTDFPDQELTTMGRRIKKLVDAGENLNGIAVLVRYNRDAHDVADVLRKLGVATVLAAGENVLEQPAIRQWLAVWRYIADGVHTDYLLSDIIQSSWWDIGPLDALRAIHAAGRSRRTMTETLSNTAFLQQAGIANPESILNMMDRLARWRSLAARMTVTGVITTMLEESTWLAKVATEGLGLANLEYMRTLVDAAKQMEVRQKDFPLAAFVELLDLHTRHDVPIMAPARRLHMHAVTVLTAHKAKGQEFTHVFLPRFIDGRWGGGRAPHTLPLPHGLVRYDLIAEGEHDEDERRLFYVALTRARQSITISYARVTETERPAVPSRFERELPANVLHKTEEQETEKDTVKRLAQVQLVAPVYSVTPLKAWLTEILSHYVLSVTHLNNYLEDPKLFYRNNLLQMPSVRSNFQAMGSAVHGALDAFLAALREEGKLPAKDYLLTSFAQYLGRESLTKQEYADALAVGEKYLADYFDFYHTQFSTHTLGEYDFRKHNVRIEGIPITGKVDKIELLEEKRVNIVDYKTGSPERGLLRVKPGGEYHRQLVFYKLLCDSSPQFPYKMVSGEVDFIRPNKSGKFIKKKVAVTENDTAELTNTIKRVWQEIMDLKFLESVATKEIVSM